MKTTLLYFLLFFCTLNTFAQLTQIGTMGDDFWEISGSALHYNSSNGHFEFWSNQDGGIFSTCQGLGSNQDSIFSFRIDDLTNAQRVLDINVPWIDWEDMTSDADGNLYIGDFGNVNSPTELQIVKIPDPNTYAGNPPSVEIIEFVYPFAGIKDMEAMFHFDGYIYLFSKRVNPAENASLIEGYTYCFRIPDSPLAGGGSHTAQACGSFQTQVAGDVANQYRVTGADISPDRRKMVLLTYNRLWVFSCFEQDDFFNGTVNPIALSFTQYEGVSFTNNHELLITREGGIPCPATYSPKAYWIDITPHIDTDCIDCNKVHNGSFSRNDYAWSLFLHSSAAATLNTTGGKAEIDISTTGTSSWHVNIRHKTIALENSKSYQISYEAYADAARPIAVIANNQAGSLGYAYFSQTLSTTPTYYSHTFTMSDPTDFNSYLSFNVGKQLAHKVYFDNITLREVGACSTSPLSLQMKAYLQGPYNIGTGRMNHDLSTLIPTSDPYGLGSTISDPSILSIVGNDAIVDWVKVELRTTATPSTIFQSRAALLQSDGDIVETDGKTPIVFDAVPFGTYHVAIRHRNHLGIMSNTTLTVN